MLKRARVEACHVSSHVHTKCPSTSCPDTTTRCMLSHTHNIQALTLRARYAVFFSEDSRGKIKESKPELKATEIFRQVHGHLSPCVCMCVFVSSMLGMASRICLSRGSSRNEDECTLHIIQGVLVCRELGNMWKEMSAEEKAPYEAKAKEDKERYKQETEEYNAKRRPDRCAVPHRDGRLPVPEEKGAEGTNTRGEQGERERERET
jgi:hypothetical protein